MSKLIKISTSKNFNSILFNLIINNNNITKSPIKFRNSILISSKDLKLIKKITKNNYLKLYISEF